MLVRWLRPECVSAARRDRYSDFMLNPPARLPVRGVLRCCVRLSDAVRIKHGGCAVQASRAKPFRKPPPGTGPGPRGARGVSPPAGTRARAAGLESCRGRVLCPTVRPRGVRGDQSPDCRDIKLDDGLREFRVSGATGGHRQSSALPCRARAFAFRERYIRGIESLSHAV